MKGKADEPGGKMLKNLEDLQTLLQVESLSGNEREKELLLELCRELEVKHGPEYLRENRQLLLAEWDYILVNLL
jgi:hypothetical protein